ncbi:MAG: carbohydrate-binding domain-containing protein [Ruminococcaceae bacterium]|nr:carbohydrate-binding domain-containing protein [Oscillospiraceae bacterium]
MKFVRTAALFLAALMLPLTSCGSTEDQLAAKASPITLEGPTASCDADGVQIDGGQITITAHGIYRISGTLADGQILVDCGDSGEVWLQLDGADITCTTGACIYIKQADLTHISLAKDTVNTLTDGTSYTFDPGDDEPDGTLFARDDLVLQGEGTLVIDANFKNAIAAKDDLTIAGGVYDITSVGHGIKGKDSLTITGGVISVDADGDGLKSTNAEGGSKGVVTITGGVVDVFAGDEGIQAISDVTVSGGVVTVDSRNNGIRSGTALNISGGDLNINAEDTPIDAPEENKTGGILTISGVVQ